MSLSYILENKKTAYDYYVLHKIFIYILGKKRMAYL